MLKVLIKLCLKVIPLLITLELSTWQNRLSACNLTDMCKWTYLCISACACVYTPKYKGIIIYTANVTIWSTELKKNWQAKHPGGNFRYKALQAVLERQYSPWYSFTPIDNTSRMHKCPYRKWGAHNHYPALEFNSTKNKGIRFWIPRKSKSPKSVCNFVALHIWAKLIMV